MGVVGRQSRGSFLAKPGTTLKLAQPSHVGRCVYTQLSEPTNSGCRP